MELFNNIKLVDLAVYLNKTLIMSDFHMGYEEALNKQGILMPRFQFRETLSRLKNIFRKLKDREIDRIIVLGDLKHEFGAISDQGWRHTLRLLVYFGQHCKEIILLKGNHDTILGPIAEKRNVKILDYFTIEPIIGKTMEKNANKETIKDISLVKTIKESPLLKKSSKTTTTSQKSQNNNILCLHGDKIPQKELLRSVQTIIIGHEHPAMSIKDGPRTELFKCFLIGKWKNKNIIVMPSFNLVTEGTDVLKEKLLSPFLKGNLKNFRVVIAADRLYNFGKLANI